MLCGGITTFSPLKHNGAGPGKRVGIVGIGGLGHFGLLYAKVRALFSTLIQGDTKVSKTLGCDKVVAISRTTGKKGDAMKVSDSLIYSNSVFANFRRWAPMISLPPMRTRHGPSITLGRSI